MKLLKYILIAIVFAATTGEAFGQAKVLSVKVTEMFGTTAVVSRYSLWPESESCVKKEPNFVRISTEASTSSLRRR